MSRGLEKFSRAGDGRRSWRILTLCLTATASSALVPPMVCILLDAEERPRAERERITADSKESLRFLPRRMLECYVLDADAITAQLTALGCATSVSVVEKALTNHLGTDLTTANLADVHGANVLKNVFSTLSASTIEFQKTRDVPSLVAWIIRHKAEQLVELRSFLRGIFRL